MPAVPPPAGPARNPGPKVAVVMGSRSDLEVLQAATEVLAEFGVPCEVRVLSAHRTPDETAAWASGLEARGLKVVIAGAGGSAALPGVVAAKTILPVLGVPIASTPLLGIDALLSTVQMPRGVPVGSLAIGKWGAANAALLALEILALGDRALAERLRAWRRRRREELLAESVVR